MPFPSDTPGVTGYLQPAESEPHACTWMQWPAHADIYGDRAYLEEVRGDLARLAVTIAQFEPVFMLARPEQAEDCHARCGGALRVLPMAVDDMWARDSGPIFVRDAAGSLAVLDYRFNGWGGKQRCEADTHVARRVAQWLDVPCIDAGFVGEGGAIEHDGSGTVVTTASCLLHPQRNPALAREDIDRALGRAMGARHVIWLPGLAAADITDGHIDAMVRFVEPGVVLIERPGPQCDRRWRAAHDEAWQRLNGAHDASGRPLTCLAMHSPRALRSNEPEFLGAYCNFYVCNGAVIAPRYGDSKTDAEASARLRDCFPGRDIVQIDVDAIHENGGGIHCVTQQQPVSSGHLR